MGLAYIHIGEQLTKHPDRGCKYKTRRIENLCKAKDLGIGGLVRCMEANPFECTSAIPHENAYYCLCEPRVYIAKVLQKK
jgi:hypothetical protein